ncbi:MAG: acriflavine resistance protein B [Planctomycetes bacterium B3_Pla]|nr:MAG: acriflavine resistance protein B [Planctomycetes bacterium B3_Pla]
MVLVKFALRNPHAIWAAAIGLCLLGLAVIPNIPADILPDFKKPVVVSFFSYPGLPTGEMEKSVTSRVERALTLAGRIEHQESRTLPGASVIKIFFQPGANASSAMNDIVNLIASDMFHLPPGMEHPFTLRSEPANLPVVLAAIHGEGLSETELYKIGYYAVRNKMGGLKGVQIPHPFGGKFRQMMVYVDPQKLHSLQLAPVDVVNALKEANLVLAGGTMKLGQTEYQIHPVNTLATPEDIDNVPIAIRNGRPIFIRDVGYAKDDAALQYNIVRVNGKRSVYCPLLREPGENTIAVVDRIRSGLAEEIPKMKDRGDIPRETEVTLVNDQSSYIRNAIRNLEYEVLLGALLVALVIALFLRKFMASLAVLLVMPLAIVIGMLGFYFTGNTINVMTLGGIALAIGTVVDAGIVVVENIMRHLNMGKGRAEAADEATTEVAAPVLAGIVTTLAIFIPAIFLTGMVKYLFTPLALAATMTIGASYLVAMTIVPAFCSRMMRTRPNRKKLDDEEAGEISEPRGLFVVLLGAALKARWRVIGVTIGLVAASYMLFPLIGTELFPDVDAGTFEVRVRTIPGTRLERTEDLVARIEDTIHEIIPEREINTILSNIGLPVGKGAGFSTVLSSNSGPDSAFLVVNLHDKGRSTSTGEYVETLRRVLKERFPQERFLFVTGGIINAALNEGVAAPIDIQVSAGTLEQCRKTAEAVVERIRDIPGAVDVQIAQMLDYPQFDIEVDRTRAAYMGLSQRNIAENVLTALGSSTGFAPMIWVDPKTGIDFFIGVQYEDNEVQSLDDLRNLPLSMEGPDGPVTIPLSNVAEVKRVNIHGEIAHYNIARVNDVYVNVSGRDMGSVVADVEKAIAKMDKELGVSVNIRGPVVTMRTGTGALRWGLVVAAILVYLVMMAQFRSIIDPLIIMLAVPLGLSGVFGMLYLTGTTLNIQSLMGTLMMIGVVVNNSILLVDFANRLRDRGYEPSRAALVAAGVRLRPILMTALTLVVSMLPLSIRLAPGSDAMIPLARALIGGMLVSTFFTLFLVPCVYSVVKSRIGPSTG